MGESKCALADANAPSANALSRSGSSQWTELDGACYFQPSLALRWASHTSAYGLSLVAPRRLNWKRDSSELNLPHEPALPSPQSSLQSDLRRWHRLLQLSLNHPQWPSFQNWWTLLQWVRK